MKTVRQTDTQTRARALPLAALLLLVTLVTGNPSPVQAATSYTVSDIASCAAFLSAIGGTGDASFRCYVYTGTLGATDTLTIAGNYGLRPQGDLVNPTTNFTNNGIVNINSAPGTLGGGLYNAGITENQGSININGYSQNYSTINNHGTIIISAAFWNGGTINNAGTIRVTCEGSFQGSGTISGNPVQYQSPCDTTPPVITPSIVGTLGNNGWYVDDVTVSWSVVDNESAITSQSGCSSTIISSDTPGTILGCSATSAGGTASQSVAIERDATAPSISVSATKADNTPYMVGTWTNQNVTVHFMCSDVGSGVAFCPADVVLSSDGVTPAASGSASDTAGNSASASFGPIQIDKTAPTVACGSADGLWHPADASIACTASDGGSGLANAADANFNLTTSVASGTETANAATVSRSVADLAGNTATAGPIAGNKIDKKAPSISIMSPTATAFTLNQVVAANFSCSDGGSGLALCAGTVANGAAINTASVGAKTFPVSATDNVANASSASVNYTVNYNWSGFFQPVDNLPVLNQMKAGSSVPVKFNLAGNQGLSIFAAGYPVSQPIACDSGAPVDDIDQTVTAGNSSLSYDATTNTYTYVWKTDKAWLGMCRQLTVRLIDGTEHKANFKFK